MPSVQRAQQEYQKSGTVVLAVSIDGQGGKAVRPFLAEHKHTLSAALALNVGDKAPNFALASTTGKEIKLADFAGKRHLVLFFYIGAFTNT